MKKTKVCMLAAALAFVTAGAQAGGAAIGFNGGTTGLGADLTVGLTDSLNARLTVTGLTYGYDMTEDGIDYDGDLKLSTAGLLVDWFPVTGSGFRLTLGALSNGNQIDAKASGNNLDIGEENYTVNGEMTSVVEWDSFAPYVGIGWGNAVAKSREWSFSLDLGVMWTDSPTAKLTASGTVCQGLVCADASAYPGFQDDLATEEANLNKDLEDAKFWPMIRVGVNYAF